MSQGEHGAVVTTEHLHAYFHDSIHAVAKRQQLPADQATLHYLTLLLSQFARSDQLFDYDRQGMQLRPLALLYADAVAADSEGERRLWLQRLGDLALFVGGLFAGRLSRHFTNLDYCVAMGGNAYGYLQQTAPRRDEQARVFGELADGFPHFIDLVATVTGSAERGNGNTSPESARDGAWRHRFTACQNRS